MIDKKRTCGTCAWWTEYPVQAVISADLADGVCHWDPAGCSRNSAWWCRHWSETTGWDRFEQMPTQLEQQAAEILEKVTYTEERYSSKIDQWLEEYWRKC